MFFPDQCAHDLMKAAADCRRLYGGPLNPKFDVCKTIHDSLAKVGWCEILHKMLGKILFNYVDTIQVLF